MRSLILTVFGLALIAGTANAAQQSTLTSTKAEQQSTMTTTRVDNTTPPHCTKGKQLCGKTCISLAKVCHKGRTVRDPT